ncbi:hypothetical protein MTR_7g062740 [Medicago truncatula]|uniref:Transmembrane protein n=1 Tax=Medicago truncatula TaxID=3880 RepID=A0A072U1D0_MEDTR|nr:hypothetical protein MTR_7g062740 [Medicago truncatula]
MAVTNFNSLASFLFQLQLIPSLLIDMKNTHCEVTVAVVAFIPKTRVVKNWTLRHGKKGRMRYELCGVVCDDEDEGDGGGCGAGF